MVHLVDRHFPFDCLFRYDARQRLLGRSHGLCVFNQLGRLSFQPLAENPFLGPSASALDRMGSLRLRYFEQNRQLWRLFASPLLHAGVIHLVLNLSCVILLGIHLEQEFGPMRIGVIYVLSALSGSVLAALFLQDRPSVASSGALYGLIGAAVSGLIQNHKVYTRKLATLIAFLFMLVVHVGIGLMPLINNFSNIGGFLSGLLVSSVLLLKPKIRKVYQNKVGIFEFNEKNSNKNTKKLELNKPILRSVSLVIFTLLFAGAFLAILHGTNLNKHCSWCKYIDCIPFKWWSCSDKTMTCEAIIGNSYESTLTCLENGKFMLLPYSNVSNARIEDLCYVICS